MVQLKYSSLIFNLFFFFLFTINILFDDLNSLFYVIPLVIFSAFNFNYFITQLDYKFFIVFIPIVISCLLNSSVIEMIYFFCFFNFWYLDRNYFNNKFYLFIFFYSLFLYFISIFFFNLTDIRGLIPFIQNHNKIPAYSISLFDNLSVTATSFFGLLLFLFGTTVKKGYIKFFFLAFGVYFILFGASRLSLILLLYSIIVKYFLNKKSHIIIFSFIIFFLPIFFIFLPNLLDLVPEDLVFLIQKDRPKYSIFTDPRVFTALEYFSIINKSPFFGVGDLNFREIFDMNDLPFSELQILLFTAKFGVISLITFLYFFTNRLYLNILNYNKHKVIVYFVFLFLMTYYGSFLQAYNFLFLLLISLLYVQKKQIIIDGV